MYGKMAQYTISTEDKNVQCCSTIDIATDTLYMYINKQPVTINKNSSKLALNVTKSINIVTKQPIKHFKMFRNVARISLNTSICKKKQAY